MAMAVASHSQLMFTLLLIIVCLIGRGEIDANRHRRQAASANSRNTGVQLGYNNGLMAPNDRNNPQQSNNNLLPSAQGQGQAVRGRDFYSSPDFKPPSFSGDKPLGWFETKYQNWVSNQDGQMNRIDGKNAPPSSLQGKASQSQRQDGGAFFLEKAAKQFAGKGEKSYNMGQSNYQKGHHSVCVNRQSYNGYTYNRFYCPLPPNTGMNQQDRFCCGIANYQYCCNEQEYQQNAGGGFDDGTFHGKRRRYSSGSRALAVILPIVCLLVAAIAVIIVLVYYKRLRNTPNSEGKPFSVIRKSDDYSEVPQESPVDRPVVPPREHQRAAVET